MRTTRIYYIGLPIAILIFVFNILFDANINNIWVFISLFFGWFNIIDNPKIEEPSVVIVFPLIKKMIKTFKQNHWTQQ